MTRSLRRVTPALLRGWPLPVPARDADKEDRGRLLIIAGASDNPGAAILAATAALRAGVGKVSVATVPQARAIVCLAVPEARVVSLSPVRGSVVATADATFDTVLIGPGLKHSAALTRLVRRETAARPGVDFILDAGAIDAMRDPRLQRVFAGDRSAPRCLITPHAGEMAALLGIDKEALQASASEIALDFARKRNVVTALKGARTFVAAPQGELWVHERPNAALASSGSGDVLAGIIGGLCARGASLPQAAVWGVALHAMAGKRLVARFGAVGSLARELAQEVPAFMELFRPRATT